MANADAKPLTSVECANVKRPWQEPVWLADWRPTERPPVPAQTIGISLAQLDVLLEPADQAEIVLMLMPLVELFGPLRPEAVPRYVETLGDIPAPALATAIHRCMRECKFFPAPVEIRERADDFHHWQTAKNRLETALWRIDFEAKRR
jgi:hypothetical protein